MRIYRLAVSEGYEWILPVDSGAFEALLALDGKTQADWCRPRMQVLKVNDIGEPRRYSDFPWLGSHAPMLRERAVEKLGTDLEGHGELLPLACAEPVWLFNVTTVIDALDQAKSQIARFEDGSVMNIEQHVFQPRAIGGHKIFKLPHRASCTYVTGKFVEVVRRSGLFGASFELIWADDDEPAGERFVHLPAGHLP
jgi:hypothetical protein